MYMAEIASVFSIFAALFAAWQAHLARRSLKQANLERMYLTFSKANEEILRNPDLMYHVYGLDRKVSETEARNIAYLSILLDGFQQYWSTRYKRNASKIIRRQYNKPTYFNRPLSRPENIERWQFMKDIYYGEYDRWFVRIIDEIIKQRASSDKPK